jgi:hypothetical protein
MQSYSFTLARRESDDGRFTVLLQLASERQVRARVEQDNGAGNRTETANMITSAREGAYRASSLDSVAAHGEIVERKLGWHGYTYALIATCVESPDSAVFNR